MSRGVVQVVTADGEFNSDGVSQFIKDTGVETAGQGYTVVAIMGPQSSGKSTLLNNLFGTNFQEMDALTGRNQTTRGIWLASSPKIAEPKTLVLDLEGSDGRERGEDDTSFERQSSLFALAAADIVLVNMWAKDVGRETGAGKPLLKTIFQVNLRLFQPAPGAKRTVLLFVFRDKTKTPMEKLVETWQTDLNTLWDSIAKPPQYEGMSIADFFDVQYTALSNFEDRNEEFMAETVLLRRKFTDDDESGYLRENKDKLPGSTLQLSMGRSWELIRENRDLNLPAHRLMIAKIRCEELAAECLNKLSEDDMWTTLLATAISGSTLVDGFGAQLAGLMQTYLTAYDEEAMYFDHAESTSRRKILNAEVQTVLKPAFDAQLNLAAAQTLQKFKDSMQVIKPGETFVQRAKRCTATAIEKFNTTVATTILVPGIGWTPVAAKAQLEKDIAAHTASLRSQHIETAVKAVSKASEEDVGSQATPLFETPPTDLWARLSVIVATAAAAASRQLKKDVAGYDVHDSEFEGLKERVAAAARARLLVHAKEAANTALPRIKDRFNEVFNRDEEGLPRSWSPSADVGAAAAVARRSAAVLLAQLAVVRLDADEDAGDEVTDAITSLVEASSGGSFKGGSFKEGATTKPGGFDILSATKWPGVSENDVLLSPGSSRTVWRQFWSDSALAVQQAMATQEANRAAQNRLPPLWAIFAMVILGFNEFVAVLRNPLLLLLIVLLVLFVKTVYTELDVEAEMQRGLLPGTMSISAKFVPTVRSVSQRTFQSAVEFLQERAEDAHSSGSSSARSPRSAVRAAAHNTTTSTHSTTPHRVEFTNTTHDGVSSAVEAPRQRKTAAVGDGDVEMTDVSDETQWDRKDN